MPSEGMRAHGTLFKKGDGGGPEVFTTIAEVKNISGPGMTRETFDLTTHSSTGAAREFGVGLIDNGEVTLDMNFVPTNATQDHSTGVIKDFTDGTKRNFQLVFPSSPARTAAFAGYFTNVEPGANVEDLLALSVTVKVTGPVTWS